MMTQMEIIDYIKKTYDINPEYLWKKTPDAAVFRHKDNRKWFCLIMNVNSKLYLNVKTEPNYSDLLRNAYAYIIPAYHMNKEHWNTIVVSEDVDEDLVMELIEQSYELTK